MTVYVIDNLTQPKLFDVTLQDIKFHNPHLVPEKIEAKSNPKEILEQLMMLPLDAGDIVCFAGLTPRRHTWTTVEIAVENSWNIMPGKIVDHRAYPIESEKILQRKPQDLNGHRGCAELMIIGNPLEAVESWATILEFTPEQIWNQYLPETPSIKHWLSAAAALHSSWICPDWFPLVDMSIRDLEIAPVMYASNHWADWIAFYPANGNFKLENHAQLYPVWLDHSEKPLEYWRNE